jgi:segregation and condensation protein A
LVVAAKLLLIKSRVLLPQPPAPPESEEDDIGEDLVRQLIEYKRFREIASWFRELDQKGFQSYVRLAGTPSIEPITDLGDVSLDDLLAAVREVLALKPAEPSVDTAVAPIRIRMADQIQLIERETAGGKRVSFRHLLEGARSRLEVIVTLLALLELVKQLRVTMRQGGLFGDIEIQARESSGPEVEQGPSSGPEALADTTSPVD